MGGHQNEPFPRSSGTEQHRLNLKRALDEIHIAHECESKNEISETVSYSGCVGREKYLLIIPKELLLNIHACAEELDIEELDCIRLSIRMFLEFVERGANKDTIFILDTPGIDRKYVEFVW